MAQHTLTAYIEFDPDTQLFVGSIPSLPGAHTQGETLDELRQNLKEVIELCAEERKSRGEEIEINPFVGIQQIEVTL
jgi:predicted RNase H-like HicB family nuclease